MSCGGVDVESFCFAGGGEGCAIAGFCCTRFPGDGRWGAWFSGDLRDVVVGFCGVDLVTSFHGDCVDLVGEEGVGDPLFVDDGSWEDDRGAVVSCFVGGFASR